MGWAQAVLSPTPVHSTEVTMMLLPASLASEGSVQAAETGRWAEASRHHRLSPTTSGIQEEAQKLSLPWATNKGEAGGISVPRVLLCPRVSDHGPLCWRRRRQHQLLHISWHLTATGSVIDLWVVKCGASVPKFRFPAWVRSPFAWQQTLLCSSHHCSR